MKKKELLFPIIIFSLVASLFTLTFHVYGNAITESLGVSLVIDADAPQVYILSPENKTYENSITISYLVIETSLDTVWYSLIGSNTTINSTINSSIMLALDPGPYQLILYANDTFGRTNSTDVNFSVIKTQPPPGGQGGESGSAGGAAGSPSKGAINTTNKSTDNRTIERFLRVKLQLLNTGGLKLKMFIESNAETPLIINYEVTGENAVYQESETTEFKSVIEKDLKLNVDNLDTGEYIVQATVRQDNITASDQQPFALEREIPLKIKKRLSFLPLILSLLLLLTYLTLLKLQLNKMKEKKNLKSLEESQYKKEKF